jgi:hypothetical protein
MSSGSRRLPAQSDSEDSSSEDSAAKATQGPKRRGRDVTPDENPAPLPPRARKATSKQSKTGMCHRGPSFDTNLDTAFR